MSGPWEVVGNRYRCTRHDVEFSRVQICAQCEEDPQAFDLLDEDEPSPPAPTGCLTSEELERRLVDAGTRAMQRSDDLWDVDGEMDRLALAVKLIEVGIKSYRAAGEYARSREAEVSMDRKMRKMAALKDKARH